MTGNSAYLAAINTRLYRSKPGNAGAHGDELQHWEQNKDITKARQVRDWKDTLAVLQYLQERNLFSNDPRLQSIAIGVHAHSTVNFDTA